jgi:hypothetical protein
LDLGWRRRHQGLFLPGHNPPSQQRKQAYRAQHPAKPKRFARRGWGLRCRLLVQQVVQGLGWRAGQGRHSPAFAFGIGAA